MANLQLFFGFLTLFCLVASQQNTNGQGNRQEKLLQFHISVVDNVVKRDSRQIPNGFAPPLSSPPPNGNIYPFNGYGNNVPLTTSPRPLPYFPAASPASTRKPNGYISPYNFSGRAPYNGDGNNVPRTVAPPRQLVPFGPPPPTGPPNGYIYPQNITSGNFTFSGYVNNMSTTTAQFLIPSGPPNGYVNPSNMNGIRTFNGYGNTETSTTVPPLPLIAPDPPPPSRPPNGYIYPPSNMNGTYTFESYGNNVPRRTVPPPHLILPGPPAPSRPPSGYAYPSNKNGTYTYSGYGINASGIVVPLSLGPAAPAAPLTTTAAPTTLTT